MTASDVKQEDEGAPAAAAAEFKPTLWTVSGDGGADRGDAERKDLRDGEGTDKASGGSDGDGEGAEGDAAQKGAIQLSKNALKRLAKHEAWEKRKAVIKAQEKEQRRQKGEEVRAEHKAKLEAMTEEERAKYDEERAAIKAKRKKEAEEAKAKKAAALTSPHGVVLDLEFGHLMQDKEIRSLAKQLAFCYSANTKVAVPVRLYLTGVEGRVSEIIRKSCSGFANWVVMTSEESYLEKLADRKKDLVYLTADSENELEDFKEEDIYVIGGIVDRNRYKNLTLDKANEQGIRHARLPIQNHLKMTGTHVSARPPVFFLHPSCCNLPFHRMSSLNTAHLMIFLFTDSPAYTKFPSQVLTPVSSISQILTVNQTVDIIHAQLELRDWEKALNRVVPLRKRKAEDDGYGEPAEKK